LELAQTAQRAENAFVGVASGLMDQFASVHGVADAAILLDCRSLDYRTVRLPLAEHRLVVVHSGAPRRLQASAYNDRRADCQRALAVARRIQPRVETLRDVDAAMLEQARPSMDETAHRRARHVISENDRVLATVAAFAEGDLDGVGRQWAASHVSLRDDFEVSIPALDALVEIAMATEGVIAARMTGAGFGGCTVNLLRRDALERFEAAVERDYEGRTGLRARVIPVEAAPGAGRLA
jgi:galactokinase